MPLAAGIIIVALPSVDTSTIYIIDDTFGTVKSVSIANPSSSLNAKTMAMAQKPMKVMILPIVVFAFFIFLIISGNVATTSPTKNPEVIIGKWFKHSTIVIAASPRPTNAPMIYAHNSPKALRGFLDNFPTESVNFHIYLVLLT